ncbi:nischarin isoform X1 [Pelobates fuscus]|uniref:nischarin isoform X1 n=1 Tax=Pelobates fuscus TaxID=191477 RepID=UPI002FE4EC93
MDGLSDSGENERPRGVRVLGSEPVENYTVYIIEVYVGIYHWRIKHRYSDFYDLHEKLTLENKIDKNLLPPKKIIGKNSKSFVERRQKDLEVYLQTLLAQFPTAVPRPLAHFLNFHSYEMNGIAAVLAEELFNQGEQLLSTGEVFILRPLQLYAVTQLLRNAKPAWANGDAKTDLGHILDFTCRLKYLKVVGTQGPVGTSNIQEHLLAYDLSIFKSLCQIEISHCDARNLSGLNSCKNTLATMTVQFSTSSMKDIIVPEALEFADWEPEGTSSQCPITAVVPKWKALTTLDMSHNNICVIDDSVKLIPQIEYLALSHNAITSVENLQYLYNLVHLDLSYNKLSTLDKIHTKLGNIKTLNLAGNLLESLSGLHKLYSLVNLDISNNKIKELDDIKHIGQLPCIENVNLTHNPLTIIPDYRTKVLAQFGERASEVCLDNTCTTEKELDTVEVLKAIQKAKETKSKLMNSDKKMSGDSRLTAARSTASSSFPANASSPLSPSVSRSQDQNTAVGNRISVPSICNPADYTGSQVKPDGQEEREPIEPNISGLVLQDGNTNIRVVSVDDMEEKASLADSHYSYIPSSPYCNKEQDLIPYLSASIALALKQASHVAGEKESKLNPKSDSSVSEPEDGYFEMGLHQGSQTLNESYTDLPSGNPEDIRVQILQFLWTFSIQLQMGIPIKQFASCLVLTDEVIAIFEVPGQRTRVDHPTQSPSLKLAYYYSYGDLLDFRFIVPETCLMLKMPNEREFFIMSTTKHLQDLYRVLNTQRQESCLPAQSDSVFHYGILSLQEFIQQLANDHQLTLEDTEVKGCFSVCLFDKDQHEKVVSNSLSSDLYSVIYGVNGQSVKEFLPGWLFLTQQHLISLKLDFDLVPTKCNLLENARKHFQLKKIPLSCVVLHPRYKSLLEKDGHILQFIMEYCFSTAFFILPGDKFHFLDLYKVLRTSLQCVKDIILFKSIQSLSINHSPLPIKSKMPLQNICSQNTPVESQASYPSENLVQKLSEENQIPFYMSISSTFRFLSEINASHLLQVFHNSISEVENEELRHLMWSSVIFYKRPDLEVTSCVLLSTKAIYFLLDDSYQPQNSKLLDSWNQSKANTESSSYHLSYCFAIKFSDLQSVNIGLFDQYFRITGPSPCHVVTCVTRDGYNTHTFIQHLMSALSLLARAPSPEPAEKDFYSEFGNKNIGKMENYELIHSSRVKFIYPNEEEIGDLTFIVKEKTEISPDHQSLNILLYVLVFQVNSANGDVQNPFLRPKTLILTNSDLFLLNEDYICYPLPDFAKEPPKTDKYQLVDGRRIRDLDRVLLGYQTYPQTLTFVFDDIPSKDLMYTLSIDHFGETCMSPKSQKACVRSREVHWYIFIPSADCREKLISLLARQWEILCGRELPLELTG